MEASREAAKLIDEHGRKAQQIVIGQVVATIRAGDDESATSRGEVLRAIDKIIWGMSPARLKSG